MRTVVIVTLAVVGVAVAGVLLLSATSAGSPVTVGSRRHRIAGGVVPRGPPTMSDLSPELLHRIQSYLTREATARLANVNREQRDSLASSTSPLALDRITQARIEGRDEGAPGPLTPLASSMTRVIVDDVPDKCPWFGYHQFVECSPDGQSVMTAGGDGGKEGFCYLRLYHANPDNEHYGQQFMQWPNETTHFKPVYYIHRAKYSGDGKTVVVVADVYDSLNYIHVVAIRTRDGMVMYSRNLTLGGQIPRHFDICVLYDGDEVIINSPSLYVAARDGGKRPRVREISKQFGLMQLSKDERSIYTIDQNGLTRIKIGPGFKETSIARVSLEPITYLAMHISEDEQSAIVAEVHTAHVIIREYDLRLDYNGLVPKDPKIQLKQIPFLAPESVDSVRVSLDGTMLAIAFDKLHKGRVMVLNIQRGESNQDTIDIPGAGVEAFSWAPGGRLILLTKHQRGRKIMSYTPRSGRMEAYRSYLSNA